jgi:hypothetical protein
MEPESSLLFGIALRLPSPPTRVAHHDETGGRKDPLHNAINLIGSNREGEATDTDNPLAVVQTFRSSLTP